MNNNRINSRPDPVERDATNNRLESQSSIPGDLPDSPRDQEELRTEETFIDLPDVKDIPGQEFVNTPTINAMADTTISSDDEEGADVFDRDDTEETDRDSDFDVRPDERKALEDETYLPTNDENMLRTARMDDTDFQGDPLNEGSFGVGDELSGEDLDIPDSTDETTTTSLGQGDEENNYYSLGSQDNDNVTEGTP
jgi:hypothetical protein